VRAVLLALATSGAHADVRPDPGDYTALPAGTNLLLGYAQFPRADKVYSHGNKVVDNLDLSINAGILRYVHFMKLGDYIIDPQIILPFGSQKIGLSDSKTSGIGDVIFGGTLWTIADLAKGEHLGWSVFFTAPTGGDKNQGFALSNNRWATDLQVGYIRKLSNNWTIDLIGETEFYQDQRDTKSRRTRCSRPTATCATTSATPPTWPPPTATPGAPRRSSTAPRLPAQEQRHRHAHLGLLRGQAVAGATAVRA
jgi:hypothetical protein